MLVDLNRYVLIDTNGKVVRYATSRAQLGIIIVDEYQHKPLLAISEQSDDETVNLFIDAVKQSSGIVDPRDFPERVDAKARHIVPDGTPVSDYELLANRHELTDSFAPKFEREE